MWKPLTENRNLDNLRAMEPDLAKTFCTYVKHLLKYAETREEFNKRHLDLNRWLGSLKPTKNLSQSALAIAKTEMETILAIILHNPDVCMYKKLAVGKVTFGWHSSSMNER